MAPRKDGLPRRVMSVEERARRRAAKLGDAIPQFIAQPQGGVGLEHAASPRAVGVASAMREAVMKEGAFGAPPVALDILNLTDQTLMHEHEVMSGAVLAEEQELGLGNFWYFLTQHLFPTTWAQHYSPDFHKDICYELQDLKAGEDLWIFIQREGKKTFVADIAHTIWMICKDPNIRVLLIGAREETVKPFARMILSAFEKGTPGFERFQAIYPDMVIEGRGMLKQSFQFIHPRRTIALPDPTFRASYIAVSGAGWRCDVLKFDDPVERRSVNTPEMSAKTSRQMMDLFPLVDTGSRYKNIIGLGCLPADSLVTMENGAHKRICDIQVGEKVWATDTDCSFEAREVAAVLDQGVSETLTIRTTAHELRTTPNHPFLRLREPEQTLEWCRADALAPKDLLVAIKEIPGNLIHPWMNEEFFWLVGFYLGDGWANYRDLRGYVCFAKGVREELNEKVLRIAGEWFPQNPFYETPFGYYRADNLAAAKALEELGLFGTAKTKRVPYWAFLAPSTHRRALLKGLCEADGSNLDHDNWAVEICNKALIGDLRQLANLCGVRTGQIGFRRRVVKAPNSKEPTPVETWRSSFNFLTVGRWENYGSTFRAHLPENVRVERVVQVTKNELNERVYDLTVAGTPSFFANGLAVHNTRWAYHDPYGLVIGEKPDDSALAQVALDLIDYPKPKVFIRHAMEDPRRLCEHCPADVVKRHPHGHPSLGPEAVATCFPIHTRESLMQQFGRYKMDPNLGEALFWHQYQNVCMAPSSQKFKKEWFFDVEVVDWVAPKLRALLIDSASKDFQAENRGDFMVAAFVSFDEQGRMLVRHGLRSNRWTKDEFQRQILAWCKMTGWWPRIVAKEKFGEGSGAFLTDIGTMFASETRPVHLIAVTRPPELLRKNDWIVENLQGPFERGEILWGSRCPREVRDRAEYELCNLNQVAHEDVADTLALGMVKGVRPLLAYRPLGGIDNWTAPHLGLYEPGESAPPPNFGGVETPMRQAGASSRVQAAVQDLGFSEDVQWDPRPVEGLPAVALPDFE